MAALVYGAMYECTVQQTSPMKPEIFIGDGRRFSLQLTRLSELLKPTSSLLQLGEARFAS